MALVLDPAPGEVPVDSRPVPAPWWGLKGQFRFGFLVTARAVYLPVRRRGFHIAEALEAKRLPLTSIKRVDLSAASAFTPRVFLNGALLLFSVLVLLASRPPGYLSWRAFVVPAMLLLLLDLCRMLSGAGGRFRLVVLTESGPLEYTPAPEDVPLPVSRRRAREAQLAFLQACQRVGIEVHDRSAERIPTAA